MSCVQWNLASLSQCSRTKDWKAYNACICNKFLKSIKDVTANDETC